jgi:hypothetical protein
MDLEMKHKRPKHALENNDHDAYREAERLIQVQIDLVQNIRVDKHDSDACNQESCEKPERNG